MASGSYNGDKISAAIRTKLQANITAACILVQRSARRNASTGGGSGLHRRTGQLVNSIAYEVHEDFGRVGSNLKYARIHEFGGVITPKTAGALAVPVHPDAKRAPGPRSFGGQLAMVTRPGKPPLLIRARDVGKGSSNRNVFDVMYVLLKSVTIPARPYLRPALANNQDRIREILARGIGK